MGSFSLLTGIFKSRFLSQGYPKICLGRSIITRCFSTMADAGGRELQTDGPISALAIIAAPRQTRRQLKKLKLH
jgi:hypothetical protein